MKKIALMKNAALLIVGMALFSSTFAQEKIYRCGKQYTNSVTKEQAKSCKEITPKELTPAELDLYQKCRFDATKSPTEAGLRIAIAVCNEKFGR